MSLELDVSPFLCEREVLPLLSELVGEPFWKFADFGEALMAASVSFFLVGPAVRLAGPNVLAFVLELV